MWEQRIAAVEAGGLEAIADGTLTSWLTEEYRDTHPDVVSRVRAMVTANDPQGYIACCRALQGLDYFRRLGDVTVPCLFVGGAQDMGASPEVMQTMADATPDARFVEIPNAAQVANINPSFTFE